jgi:hypothetical protein
MIISSVENVLGLYLVDQVYDPVLLDEFLQEDIEQVPWKSLPLQEHWLRKNYKLFPPGSCWHKLQQSVDYAPVNKMGYYKYSSMDTSYWVDLPGFKTGMHQDNAEVQASLQVYLDTAPDLGTQFVDSSGGIFAVPYKKNSGYLMINCGQLHGFPGPSPQPRLSTYTWLKPKS